MKEEEEGRRALLISWNVAGWSTTSAAIRQSYGSLQHFFECTGADIICLQECKGTWAKLKADAVAMGASDSFAHKRRDILPPVQGVVLVEDEGRGGVLPSGKEASACAGAAAPAPSGAGGGGVEGWESFWAFSGPAHRGLNGVVTFARRGLTWRCDNAPFAERALNEEGRVVVTHHSSFVVVNVYVPNARGGARLEFKLHFLEALKALLAKLRKESQRPVILAGDLNMTYRPEDASWSLQRIHLRELMALNAEAASAPPSGRGDAADEGSWDRRHPHMPRRTLTRLTNAIAHLLCKQLVEIAGKSAEKRGAPGAESKRGGDLLLGAEGGASAPLPSRGMATLGGGGVDAGGGASLPRALSAVSVDTPADPSASSDARLHGDAVQRALRKVDAAGSASGMPFSEAPVALAELYDCGFRSAFVSELLTSAQGPHNKDVFALTRLCGLPPHGQESVRYISSLLHETHWRYDADAGADPLYPFQETAEKMWDTFRIGEEDPEGGGGDGGHHHHRRYCPCPYTCWDQSRNKRASNEGTRLDYILLDSALVPFVVPRCDTPNNTGFVLAKEEPPLPRGVLLARAPRHRLDATDDFFSAFSGAMRTDSIRRAMADGLYSVAPFDGSGLEPLRDGARGCAFCGLPSTGLFITPPQFSDHIGVCVAFQMGEKGLTLQPRQGKVVEDSERCLYRPPVGLHSFFQKAASTAPRPPVTTDTVRERGGAAGPSSQPGAPPAKAPRVEVRQTVEVVDVDDD